MKIEKFAPSLSNMFRAFCEEYWPESNNDEDLFFMDYCPKESLLKSLDKKEDMSYIYMAIEENHCVGYFYYEKYFKYDVFSFGYFLPGNTTNALTALCSQFPGMVLSLNDYCSVQESEAMDSNRFQRIDARASFEDRDERNEYAEIDRWYAVDGKSDIVEFLESHFFPEINIKDMEFEVLDGDELATFTKEKMFHLPYGYPIYGGGKIVGFHYLCMNNMHRGFGFNNQKSDIKMLIAHVDGTLVGCICFGVWPNNNYQSLSFIDVAIPYRNRGVAKMMAKELDKHLNPELPLVLTDESEMGKECGMAKLFKKSIKSTKVYENREFFSYI